MSSGLRQFVAVPREVQEAPKFRHATELGKTCPERRKLRRLRSIRLAHAAALGDLALVGRSVSRAKTKAVTTVTSWARPRASAQTETPSTPATSIALSTQ